MIQSTFIAMGGGENLERKFQLLIMNVLITGNVVAC